MTGAIILIVIAVALLPELLTGAGSKGRLAMDDGRAADGPPLVSYKIDLTGNAPRPATAERDAAPLAPAEATPAPPVAATPAPAPASPPTTAPATSVATAPAPAATAPMPPAAAPAVAPIKPTTAAPAHAEPAKSETKLVVQVGSFRDRKAADVREIRKVLGEDPNLINLPELLHEARESVRETAAYYMRLWGAAGKSWL